MGLSTKEKVFNGVGTVVAFYFAGSNYLQYKSVEGNTPKATGIQDFHKKQTIKYAGMGAVLAMILLPRPKNPVISRYWFRFRLVFSVGVLGYVLYDAKNNIQELNARFKEKS